MEPRDPIEAAPSGPAPAMYWADTDPPRSARAPMGPAASRGLLALAWLTALALAAFNAFFLAGRRSGFLSGSPVWEGYVVGAFLLPFLLALVARAVLVWIGKRRGAGGRPILRSGWIPLGAMLLVGLNGFANLTALAPPRAVDPKDAIRISGPFTLRSASADTQQIAAAGFKNDKTVRDYEVREIVGDDGSLSLLVVVDGSFREAVGTIEQIGRGIESASGLTAAYETIRDRRVAIAVGDTLSIGAWIEEPLGVYVYAVTPTRLHQIIEGILDAPRPAS